MRAVFIGSLLGAALSGCHVLAGVEGLVFEEKADGPVADDGEGPSGSEPCTPGTSELCYDGPAWNAGVGACARGSHTCLDDGSGFGPCEGSVLATYESCGATVDLNCDGELACTGTPLTAAALGGGGADEAVAVAVTPTGEIVVGGTFEDAIAFGPSVVGPVEHESHGQRDIFVSRLDAAGTPLASASFGSQGDDELTGLAIDGQGGVVLGGLYAPVDAADGLHFGSSILHRSAYSSPAGEAFLMKLDATFAPAWALGAGGYDRDTVHDFSVASDGTITAVARCWGDCRWSAAPETLDDFAIGEDWSVQAFDAGGALSFQRNFTYLKEGTAEPEFRVARADDGEILIAGWLHGSLWITSSDDPASLEAEHETAFLVRMDAEGEPTGIQSVAYSLLGGGNGGIRVTDMAIGPDAAVYLTGHFSGDTLVALPNTNQAGSGDVDGFVLKLSRISGAYLAAWAVVLRGSGPALATGVTVDPDGKAIVVGHFEGEMTIGGVTLTSAEGHDVFVAKLEPDSTVLWAQRVGGPFDQLTGKPAVLPTGHVVTVGSFYGAFDAPGPPLESAGDADAFALILAP